MCRFKVIAIPEIYIACELIFLMFGCATKHVDSNDHQMVQGHALTSPLPFGNMY